MAQKKPKELSYEKKIEIAQYEIFNEPTESREQKEVRLKLMSVLGLNAYNAWFKDMPFKDESDYIFIAPSLFHKQICQQRFEYVCGDDHLLKFEFKSAYVPYHAIKLQNIKYG